MGACSDKNKGAGEEILSPEIVQLNINRADSGAMEKLLTVSTRNVAPAEANLALAKLGLDSPDNGAFSWDNKSGKAGNYTYNNLSGTGKDGERIKIKTLELTGVHMVDDNPNFDRIDIQEMNVTDEDGVVTIDRLSLARPSPKLGASILEAIDTIDKIKDLRGLDIDIDFEDEDIQFGALLLDSVNMTSGDGNVKLGSLGWGEHEDTQEGLFLLENLDITSREKRDDPAAHITLKSISATGLNMEHMRKMKADETSRSLFSPYEKVFDSFALKDFKLSVDTLAVAVPSITSQSETDGDDVIIRQSLEPMTLSFTEMPTDPDILRGWKALKQAGYEKIELSGSSTTILNESEDTLEIRDSFLRLKDGFDLRFSLLGHGLSDVTEKASQQSDKIDTDDLMDTLTLSSLNLSLTDTSIVDRAFNVVADEQGQKASDLKKLAKGALFLAGFTMSLQADGPEESKAITQTINSLSGFIEDGGTINVSLNPKEPLPAGYLSKLNAKTIDPATLGLTITHQK